MTLPERITEKPLEPPPRHIKAAQEEPPKLRNKPIFQHPRTEIKPPAIRRLTASLVMAR